jgi:hypothetical protein
MEKTKKVKLRSTESKLTAIRKAWYAGLKVEPMGGYPGAGKTINEPILGSPPKEG